MRKKATPTPRKAKLDRQRDTTIQRYRRLIQVAVRQDDEVATERWVKEATKAGVTKIVVDKVLQRSRNRGALDEMTYEGTLPGGVAIIVEALTDNKSRTAQDVRHLFSEGGGTLGASGSALWAFERCGLLELSTTDEAQRDALLDFAMGLEGIENVVEKEAVEGSGSTGIGVEVWVAPKELSSLRAALTTEGHHPFNEQLLYKPVSPMGSLEAEVRIHTRMHTCRLGYAYMHACMRMHACIAAAARWRRAMHTHTHIHTHTHTHTHARARPRTHTHRSAPTYMTW